MKKAIRADLIVVLTLVLVAAFFRLYRLQEWPPGLWRDEAANGLEALRVLDGDLAIFYGTREPMFIYLVALSIATLGRNALGIRITAAAAGTATVPATYFLVKEMLRSAQPRARLIAALTSIWLATSYWHVNFSRLGFRGVLLPLLAALTFYFLWQGWNQLNESFQRRRTYALFALSGACLALTLYTYTPGRFLPLLVLPFVAQSLRGGYSSRGEEHRRSPSSWRPARHFGVFALCFVVILAPLGTHFLAEPKSLLTRSGVTIFSAESGEPLPVLIAGNLVRQLGMFGFLSDPNTRHNPAGRPAFDPVTLLFFAIGLLVSIRLWRQLPYLFCLVWFLALQIPAILTYPELPHSLRAIGALPVAFVFPALGMDAGWEWVRARTTSFWLRIVMALVLALSLLIASGVSFQDYFAPRVEEIELVKAFDPRFVEISSTMNELDESDSVWLVPVGPNGEQRMAYFVIDFLHQGQAPHRYIRVDEEYAALDLSEACRGFERAYLLHRMAAQQNQPWHELYADPQGVIISLMDKHARQVRTLGFDGFDVLVYRLASATAFLPPSTLRSPGPCSCQGIGLPYSVVGFGTEGSRGVDRLPFERHVQPETGYDI
jgi:hypothetical protein